MRRYASPAERSCLPSAADNVPPPPFDRSHPQGSIKQATTPRWRRGIVLRARQRRDSTSHGPANYSTRKTRYPIWLTRRTIEPSASDFNEPLPGRADRRGVFNPSTRLSLEPYASLLLVIRSRYMVFQSRGNQIRFILRITVTPVCQTRWCSTAVLAASSNGGRLEQPRRSLAAWVRFGISVLCYVTLASRKIPVTIMGEPETSSTRPCLML